MWAETEVIFDMTILVNPIFLNSFHKNYSLSIFYFGNQGLNKKRKPPGFIRVMTNLGCKRERGGSININNCD